MKRRESEFCGLINMRVRFNGEGHPLCHWYEDGRCKRQSGRCVLERFVEPLERDSKRRLLG